MRHRRWFVIMGLSVAAAAMVGAGSFSADTPAATPAAGEGAAPHRPVRVQAVTFETTTETRIYAAVVKPRVATEVGFRVTGKLEERLVDVGQTFAAGDVLARLDPVDLELRLRASEAQLVSANADAQNARNEFERTRTLRDKGWSTKQTLDQRRAELDAADALVRQRAAELDLGRNNRAYAELKASGPGVVTGVLAEPGRVLSDGDPVLAVAYTDALEIEAEIPEQQAASLADGELRVAFWALPGVDLPGRLRELSPIAEGATRTYRARVALAQTVPQVQLGMTASLEVAHRNGQAMARLSLAAIDHAGDQPAVWVVGDEGRLELRPVEVAAFTARDALIASGLAAGEQVVTAGVHKLDVGQRVRIWTEPDR